MAHGNTLHIGNGTNVGHPRRIDPLHDAATRMQSRGTAVSHGITYIDIHVPITYFHGFNEYLNYAGRAFVD